MTSPIYFVSIKIIKITFCIKVIFYSFSVLAISGVTDHSIVFGQSAALSKDAKHLGINMRDGILTAFQEVNQKGGVYGRKLKLISLDDAYEPELAIQNTRSLINQHKVFAFIGGVGTPTSKSVVPILSELSIPYIGPFTGAEFLREKNQRHVINIRASYYQEVKNITEQLLTDLNVNRISILYQDDSYGRAGLNGLNKALKNKNKKIASQGVYLRNTTAVKIALLEIMQAQPEAVVIVGSYLPAAKFIQIAKSINFQPIFICLSFVGTEALYKELKHTDSEVVVTQVVPFPFDVSHPLVLSYQKAIKNKNVNFVSLEGYLVGRFTIDVLKKAGRNLTRKKFLQTVQSKKDFSIDGFSLNYGYKDNQGSDKIFFTAISQGKLISLDHLKEIRSNQKKTSSDKKSFKKKTSFLPSNHLYLKK